MLNFKTDSLTTAEQPARIALPVLLLAQFVIYSYYVVEIPLHYDEWHSWRFFANTGFWNIFTNYPAPNNHVLYNLVARVFIVSGIDPAIAIRLPSLLASLLTSWYFYKLSRQLFGSFIAVLLVAVLISFYDFIVYSVEARGYSFINLFCVLLLYASLKLSRDYSGKYRLLLILSQSFGLLSIPTFLYPMIPVGIVLFGYATRQGIKPVSSLLLDYAAAFFLVVLGYSGILFIGDPQNFLNPQVWTEKFTFSDPLWFDNLVHYLDTRFFELFGIYRLKTSVVLVLATLVYYFFNRRRYSLFMPLVCGLMFFSPFFIVLVQKVYPFGRSFYYLILPSLLLFGLMILPVVHVLKLNFSRSFLSVKWAAACIVLSWLVFSLISFSLKHRESADWDYRVEWIREHYPDMFRGNIHEIARTGRDTEYYPAEILSHICLMDGNRNVIVTGLDSVRTQDILVIWGPEKQKFLRQMKEYVFTYSYGDIWIYRRDTKAE
jgi:hypothetical protein